MHGKKLELPMEAAMPCKLKTTKRPSKLLETDSGTKSKKTKHACLVGVHESTRKRLEATPHKDHEDHIAEKGHNSMSHSNLVHQFIPMPQAMKNSGCESRSGQGIEDARNDSSLAVVDRVNSKKGILLEAQGDKKKVHFATLMDICHLKSAEEPTFQKHKGRVVLRGDIVKDDSGSYAVFTGQGSSASQITDAKVMDVLQDYQTVMDQQLTQYPVTLK